MGSYISARAIRYIKQTVRVQTDDVRDGSALYLMMMHLLALAVLMSTQIQGIFLVGCYVLQFDYYYLYITRTRIAPVSLIAVLTRS
ncbi:hypothetical protein QQG55_7165 [Brugia pahangi]